VSTRQQPSIHSDWVVARDAEMQSVAGRALHKSSRLLLLLLVVMGRQILVLLLPLLLLLLLLH